MSESPNGPPSITERVNIISRGCNGGGYSGSARLVYAQQDIYAVTTGLESDANPAGGYAPGRVDRGCDESAEGGQPYGNHGKSSLVGHEDGRIYQRG
ncbi:hypothetical protein LIER_32295 [Lithospermum erythrorhizon]|uniref:Uncharacterized protein n=1 Tax=Lithospermum erythrorhizon TaxID=34254 RepID=A0AAV3RXB2_LITER